MKRLAIALVAALAALCTAPAAHAQTTGVQRLHFQFGPLHILPGQNSIEFAVNNQRPPVNGWIVGFQPNLSYADGSGTPRVDVIHLHHGVWLSNGAPLFAAGEEKTRITAPPGYGWRYQTTDAWILNYMIHNLTPTPTDVYLTYDLDFIPDGSPAALGIRAVKTKWLDVVGGVYPVFNVHRGQGGRDGRLTYPHDVRGAPRNRWKVKRAGVLVGAAGHLHPGGLWTTLKLRRGKRTVTLFRSRAHYFEPAGAVSWDVAMGVTPPTWRVGVKKGDVLSVSATYNTRRASWYEVMGIMPVEFSPGGTGPNPFRTRVAVRGVLTHGHLPENDHHGGEFIGLPNPRNTLSAPVGTSSTVSVRGFVYSQGDLNSVGRAGGLPVVRPGGTLRFVNRDNRHQVLHTITACRAPCNREAGIAYPLANGPVDFDSGDLGTGPPGRTAAAQRLSWKLPRTLPPGTYTYFCRIHPFMRGAFRVTQRR